VSSEKSQLIKDKHCRPIKRVLIVEDTLALSDDIQIVLIDSLDLICEVAGTETEATSLRQLHTYDLIITDIHLPDSSGNFIAKLIRDKQRILIMTSSEDEEQRDKLTALPIVDYLYKTDIKTVVNYLHRTISRLNDNIYRVIAVCDDSKVFRMRIIQALEHENLAYIEFVNGREAKEAIVDQRIKVDLLITDVYMPEMNGTDLVRHIRLHFSLNELPILALSSSEDSKVVIEMLKMGSNDYLHKPFSKEEFLLRLNTVLDQYRLHKENKLLIRELKSAASTDFLTKLYNRAYFYDVAEPIETQVGRDHESFGVVMIDVDDFKKINDTHGHEIGDQVLKKIAETIKNVARKSDIPCRWGGEEFLVLSPKTPLEQLKDFAERIRLSIEDAYPDSLPFAVTASLGIAIGDKVDPVISQADQMLYKAKHAGKNRICFE